MRAQHNRYTEEFRRDAVKLCVRGDRSLRQVAEDLGVNSWTLRDWYRMYEMKRKKQATPTSTSVATTETPEQRIERIERENAKLRREVEQLKMDREILKKAAAFFAKESE